MLGARALLLGPLLLLRGLHARLFDAVPPAPHPHLLPPRHVRADCATCLQTPSRKLALSEGGETRQPMSVAVIGGLFTSTMLTLIVIPVVYLIFDDIKERAAAGIKRYRAYRRFNRSAQSRTLNSK